ncbi:uncharacterized protein JCM6883_000690 [Sporobolomyces salmoneus]|uniref:uncharacterized protein n=1 Tax=Sporobolomyces salmoneus TaxID=183962 RepID=UPI00318095C2
MDRGRVTKRPHGGSSSRRHPHRDAVIAHALNPPNTHPPEALLGDPASSSAASGTFERHGTAATNSVPKSTKPRGREQGKYACLLCRTVVTTSVRAKSHHELFHGLKQEDDKVPCPYCSTSTRTSSWVSP